MLIHKNFVYVANPRTASRSTELLLREVLGEASTKITNVHHPKTSHPALQLSKRVFNGSKNLGVSGKKVYGVIREPLEWIVSWYNHMQRPMSFKDFLSSHNSNWLFKDDLCVYHAYITKFIPFELGVSRIVKVITGSLKEGSIEPWIGETCKDPDLWTPELVTLAKSRFQRDFARHAELSSVW